MKRKTYGFTASTKYYILPSSKFEMQFAIIGIILFIVIHSKVTLLTILCMEKVLMVLLNEPLKIGKSTVPKLHLHIYKFPPTDL